tara:strand:+ start:1647 stop:2714 length:1068 start_codon:yes stop_codon:yes gene_type:complete
VNKIHSKNHFADQTFSMVKSFASRGNLLDSSTIEGLAESKNLDDMLVKLRGTVYADVVSSIEPPLTSNKFEMSFHRHLSQIHHKLMNVTPKNEMLVAYYLKYIASNLKILLKGRAQNKSDEEISKHLDMYAEELIGRRDLIVKALSAENIEQTITLLENSEFGENVISALDIYKKTSEFQIFDIFIDKAYFDYILSAYKLKNKDDNRIRDIVSIDIDAYNGLAVLRGKLWNLDSTEIKKFLISPFFDLTERNLKAMMDAESVAESIKVLKGTIYHKIIFTKENVTESILGIEDGFQLMGYRRAFNPFLWDIDGTSIALGAIKLTELEMKNLSIIAFGVEHHLGTKDIMSKIIFLK